MKARAKGRGLALALALGLGCAQGAVAPEQRSLLAAPSADGYLTLRANGQFIQVQVTDEHIVGPDLSVARTPGSLRGSGGLELTIGPDGAVGTLLNQPFHIQVQRTRTDTEVSGLVAGQLSRFHISSRGIDGQIGLCSYSLAWSGQAYEGRRGCGRAIERTSLEIPGAMATWSDVEVAATLCIVLGGARD